MYNLFKKTACLFICFILIFASGCSRTSSRQAGTNKLKIGVKDFEGCFNPFYAVSDADNAVLDQIFRKVQYKSFSNKLSDGAGNITYEYVSDNQVKYTVTLKNNLYFSDGKNVTIDDLIFGYYFIADATYDGIYSDFYLNDIVGLKEYYYDDVNYASSLNEFDSESSVRNYIRANYSDGVDVNEISGIKKIDDYTCTVLFNSRNINAISQINMVIVSKDCYGADYFKGNAEAVKSVTKPVGCGSYYLDSNDDDCKKVILRQNKYSSEYSVFFNELDFINISGKNENDAINDGTVDLVSFTASRSLVDSLDKEKVKYSIQDEPEYFSIFYSSLQIPQLVARMSLMSLFDSYDVLDEAYGTYYTKKYLPISNRFEETPDRNELYYSKGTFNDVISNYIAEADAYCPYDKESVQYRILKKYSDDLSLCGVKLNVIVCSDDELLSAIKSGKAFLWISDVKDGFTCDKYDYYNSFGTLNYTGLSDSEIDALTLRIRRSTGLSDRKENTALLLNLVMAQCIELPVYQLQCVTAYNSELISDESFNNAFEYEGYAQLIPQLHS